MVQNAGVDRGNVEMISSGSESSTSDNESSDKNRKKGILSDEGLFKKLKSSVTARSNLASIHSARAHKYGHVQFGPKSWYKESSNISNKLTSQEDRKNFARV